MSDAIVVDTHVLLWWLAGSKRLSARARELIAEASKVLVAPITFWEVAMLAQKGRIELDRPIRMWVNDVVGSPNIDVAELTPQIAVEAGCLSDFHGDPADRLIYATASILKLALLTKDDKIRAFAKLHPGTRVIW